MINRGYKSILNRYACKRASQVMRSRGIRHPLKLDVGFDKARSIRDSARTSKLYDSAMQPVSDVDIHFYHGVHSHGN